MSVTYTLPYLMFIIIFMNVLIIRMYIILNIHNHVNTCFTGPSALQVNASKNIMNLSVAMQWDEVDGSLTTTYIITWISERDHIARHVTPTEQSSYTITGLTLDTVYTITVTASNRCGQGPEYRTSVSLSTGVYIYSYWSTSPFSLPIANPSVTATNIPIYA